MKTPLPERMGRWVAEKRWRWPAMVVAIALVLPSLGSGMIADDHYFRMLARGAPGLPEIAQSPLDAFNFTGWGETEKEMRRARGLSAWWTPPDMQIAFWRPVSALTHWADNALWGDRAWLMHLQNIAWYGLLAGAVAALYRRIGGPAWLAGLAALLYAVDDAHAVPVAWIAGRNALLSGLFAVLCLTAHDAWRRDGNRTAGAMAPPLLLLGLLSGEAAAGVGGFLFAYAAFLDPGGRPGRAASLIPYALVAIGWRVAYKGLGYGVAGSALYLEPTAQPLAYLRNLVTHIPLMVMGLFAFPDPTAWLVLEPPWSIALVVFAYAVAGGVLLLLWPLLRRNAVARFWLTGMVLAMAPSCATWPQNRLTILPGVGAMALAAHLVAAGWRRDEQTGAVDASDRRARMRRFAAYGLFALHLVIAPAGLFVSSAATRLPAAYIERLDESLTGTADVRETAIIAVSAPVDVFTVSVPFRRSSERLPVPESVLLLRGGLGEAHVFRVDAQTIIVTTPEGLVERPWSMLFRSIETHPVKAGDRFSLPNADITALSVSPRGNPIETQFRFDQPLEEAGDWRIWDGARFAPFTLPRAGESIHIPRGDVLGLTRDVLESGLTFPE